MSLVALIGDCTTTTSVALAAAWPASSDVLIVEADPSGGSLSAWLDTPATPSLSTIVANVQALAGGTSAAWFAVDSMVQQSASGVRFIAAPIRSREATRSIAEASTSIFPLLAQRTTGTSIVDAGQWVPADGSRDVVSLADTVVLCHRQADSSASAATVRLERLREQVEVLAAGSGRLVVTVIGDRPFDVDEIANFVSSDLVERVIVVPLALDHLSAAVFAGRSGVSERRLSRLPLMRSVRRLCDRIQPPTSPEDRGPASEWLQAPATRSDSAT